MFNDTVDVSVVTVCCVTSHTATCIAGNIALPTAVCVGCTWMTNIDGVPANSTRDSKSSSCSLMLDFRAWDL